MNSGLESSPWARYALVLLLLLSLVLPVPIFISTL